MISRGAKITIVGLGLLGGSYAKGFYQAGYTVNGIDIDEEAVAYAKRMHWIQEGSTDPSLVEGSDIIISALYPRVFETWVKENQQYFKPGCILTDVTGIKREVISRINAELRDDVEFIACHPMAGREYRGIQYADCNLFTVANFIIVPTDKNTEQAKQTARDIAEILKFKRISELTPEQHDTMIGFLSQLTHIIAVSLMNVSDNTHLVDYTGDSFRDLTRIAKINEDLWPELFILNKDNLIREIDDFTAEMQNFRNLIQQDDTEEMKRLLRQSTERRKCFDKK
ncbi:MAG: prephenate dehydrogenase [Solobacterium sp.]|jgi:prephenate dehydrogenase|nr:prephenate dehydrogenase [Solobacterium sp.]